MMKSDEIMLGFHSLQMVDFGKYSLDSTFVINIMSPSCDQKGFTA